MANDLKSAKNLYIATECADLSVPDGVAFIAQSSPLTRLHYFDGQYLRADSLALEQDYLRTRNRLGNLAGGWGVVNGLGVSLDGASLRVGAGLAITPAGNPVLTVDTLSATLAQLLKVATAAPAGGNAEFADCPGAQSVGQAMPPTRAYEITVGPAESLCGNEAVYGKLCATACVSDSQRPWWREGVALRLRPITLKLPDSSSVTLGFEHLRNRAASAYFAAEPWLTASALSGAGLAGTAWCNPASLYGRDEVPIGLLLLDGDTVSVLDAWSARREGMDTQARGYWQGRMAMRPWNVFLAQILQFQCQLSARFDEVGKVIAPADECGQLRHLLDRARKELEALHRQYGESAQTLLKKLGGRPSKQETQGVAEALQLAHARLYEISNDLAAADLGKGALPKDRMLLAAGFVELPPAGYLPVVPGKQSLEAQLTRMFGAGARLAYQAVRQDEIAHLVEEAQHMARLSLTRGLDDASQIEDVEIFVPDGQTVGLEAAAPGIWWQVSMTRDALGVLLPWILPDSADLKIAREVKLGEAVEAVEAKASEDETNDKARGLDERAAKSPLEQLAGLMEAARQREMQGLARTEASEGGGYRLTLVCRQDAQDLLEQARRIFQEYPDLDQGGAAMRKILGQADAALYLAGDIAGDPFELAFGEQADLRVEIRLGKTRLDMRGSLTALFDRPVNDHQVERVLQLQLLSTKADGSATQRNGQISLLRAGNAQAGELALDDAQHGERGSPVFIDWRDPPRRATLSAPARVPGMYTHDMPAMRDTTAGKLAPDANETTPTNTGSRVTLVKLLGLAGMPAMTSPLGAATMNTLISLAETGDDSAFVARARRRLFPTLDTPATSGVRAVLDWVMFRRARTRLCCAAPAAPVETGLEAFQVWHLSVASLKELKALQGALDHNDVKQLAGYAFRRVGVLRYREQNTVSEEPDDQVLAMWRQAQPGAKVLLGRYWQQAPATGQGWQNRFRLNNLLTRIAPLTQPPDAGSGAIAPLTAVSPPLSSGGLDGGMLVVTLAAANAYPHRVLMADTERYQMLVARIQNDPAQAWEAFQSVLKKQGFRQDLGVRFNGATPAAADIAALRTADTAMRGHEGEYRLSALRIASNTLLPGEDPAAQHATLSSLLRVSQQSGDFSTDDDDLGAGAHTVSVVGYTHLEATAQSYDHRVVFMESKGFQSYAEIAGNAGGDAALARLETALKGQQFPRVALVTFDNGVLQPQSEMEIKRFDEVMRQVNQDYMIKALHLDAPQARAGEDLEAQFKALTDMLGISSGDILGGFTAPAFDMRDSFRAVTLLGYFPAR